MKYWEEVQISNFNGPLDLLLEMVREKKMNVLDLNISEITDQYVSYIHSQQELDIEIASEYLTMAAMLLELKSRKLLPVVEEDQQQDDNLNNFIEQLAKYEQIRNVADFFAAKQQEYFSTYSPSKSAQQFKPVEQEEDIEDLSDSLSLEKLASIYKNALKKQQAQMYEDDIDGNYEFDDDDYNYIENAVLSPQDITDMIVLQMNQNNVKEYSIFELLPPDVMNFKNLISAFLSVLDLVKYQIITVRQNDDDTDLLVRYTQYALDNPDALNGLEEESYE